MDMLRRNGEIFQGIQSNLETLLGTEEYIGNEECSIYIAGGIANCANLSLDLAQYLIAAVRYLLLLQLGFSVTPELVAKTSPKAGCLKNQLINLAACCDSANVKVINEAHFASLAVDKGNKGNH